MNELKLVQDPTEVLERLVPQGAGLFGHVKTLPAYLYFSAPVYCIYFAA